MTERREEQWKNKTVITTSGGSGPLCLPPQWLNLVWVSVDLDLTREFSPGSPTSAIVSTRSGARGFSLLLVICSVQGLEGEGFRFPHSRAFFARILYPARFSSVSRIRLFFPRKNILKSLIITEKVHKCKRLVDSRLIFWIYAVFKGFCKKKKLSVPQCEESWHHYLPYLGQSSVFELFKIPSRLQ